MLIRKKYGRQNPITVVCDGCGSEIGTRTADIEQVRKRASRAGWVFMRLEGVWTHFCGDCYIRRKQ